MTNSKTQKDQKVQKFQNIVVKDGKNATYHHKAFLKSHGFTFTKVGNGAGKWIKNHVAQKEFMEIKNYCFYQKLSFVGYDENHERAKDYRQKFIKTHPPQKFFNWEYCRCAYCQKLCSPRKIQVDHVIPVDKAKKSKLAKFLLKFIIRAESVNDQKNLVYACRKCNSTKRAKMGLWLPRGYLGKYKIVAFMYYSMIATILYFGFRYLQTYL